MSAPALRRGTASEPLGVDAFTRQLKGLLEASLFGVWIRGEITELKVASSGHVFLGLRLNEATLKAVVWARQVPRIEYQPGPGTQVIAGGNLTVYAPHGEYRLVIERLLPDGDGARQAALVALTARLAAEGLLDPARRRPLPRLPAAVGVVTSATGAARRDIEATIHRRSPQIPIVLAAAQVQGAGAAQSIAAALDALGRHPQVAVIIVGRGGGSVEDLWAFNEEPVVRAIARSPVPVISAVGHETDVTLADRVADRRAPTPSAAAELAVPVRDDLLADVAARVERLERALARRLALARGALLLQQRLLIRGGALRDPRRALGDARGALAQALEGRLRRLRARIRGAEGALAARQPAARLAQGRRRLEAVGRRLEVASGRLLLRPRRRVDGALAALTRPSPTLIAGRARLKILAGRLADLSPLAVLGRGFALVQSEGRILRRAAEVRPGQILQIRLASGALEARAVSIEPEEQP